MGWWWAAKRRPSYHWKCAAVAPAAISLDYFIQQEQFWQIVLKVFSISNDEKCERVQIVLPLFGERCAEVLTYLRTQKLFGNDRILSIDILYLWLTALQMAPWLTHLILWSGRAIHHCFLVSKQLVCIQCHLPIISRNNNHRAAGCRPAPAAAFLEIHSGFLLVTDKMSFDASA